MCVDLIAYFNSEAYFFISETCYTKYEYCTGKDSVLFTRFVFINFDFFSLRIFSVSSSLYIYFKQVFIILSSVSFMIFKKKPQYKRKFTRTSFAWKISTPHSALFVPTIRGKATTFLHHLITAFVVVYQRSYKPFHVTKFPLNALFVFKLDSLYSGTCLAHLFTLTNFSLMSNL